MERSMSCSPKDLAIAVVALRNKMAKRGAQLLVVLLASHKLSIDAAYTAFCEGSQKNITFARFAKILRKLAPDFGNAMGRIESIFLSVAVTDGDQRDTAANIVSRQLHVCKDKWVEVLQGAVGQLRNKRFQ